MSEAETFPWSKVQHIPGTSVVNGGTLLLDASGAALGMVVVLNCLDEAIRPAITRALNTAGNVSKTLRMLDCSRREAAEAMTRGEALAEALKEAEAFIERSSGGGETAFRAKLRAALTAA